MCPINAIAEKIKMTPFSQSKPIDKEYQSYLAHKSKIRSNNLPMGVKGEKGTFVVLNLSVQSLLIEFEHTLTSYSTSKKISFLYGVLRGVSYSVGN